jgi:hypothetical protein
MKFFILGVAVLLAGMALLEVNFYLGAVVVAIGAVTASSYKGQAIQAIVGKVAKKE